jgi:phenylpropionate dioxygenase-like ring-hydroxylating dioxygenase large terminal subunit
MSSKTPASSSTADRIHAIHLDGLSRKDVSKTPSTSLHSSMYYSPEVYDLERRAIFSKRWILISHQARYREPGDFVQYEMAGFNVVVVKDKALNIVAFHNICRHRAFPLVQIPSGRARIFSCKYHGWSYDLNGKLTKAPRFSNGSVDGFESSSIRLFPIHVHVDRNGFVYINMDARDEPEISWESQYGQIDQQAVLLNSGIEWDKVEYDFTWTKEGPFNWKLMQDNYNECYHCLTAHPDVARTTSLDTYYVVPGSPGSYISHFSEPKSSAITSFDETRFAGRSATHLFPASHFSPNPGTGFMHLMRTVPTGPTATRQEYDVYKLNTPNASPEAHQRMTEFYQKVTQEDIDLCVEVQKNMQRSVFSSGPLHPFHEEGVIAFQETLKGILSSHRDAESEAGKQLWPAERVQDGGGGNIEIILACHKRSGIDW